MISCKQCRKKKHDFNANWFRQGKNALEQSSEGSRDFIARTPETLPFSCRSMRPASRQNLSRCAAHHHIPKAPINQESLIRDEVSPRPSAWEDGASSRCWADETTAAIDKIPKLRKMCLGVRIDTEVRSEKWKGREAFTTRCLREGREPRLEKAPGWGESLWWSSWESSSLLKWWRKESSVRKARKEVSFGFVKYAAMIEKKNGDGSVQEMIKERWRKIIEVRGVCVCVVCFNDDMKTYREWAARERQPERGTWTWIRRARKALRGILRRIGQPVRQKRRP